MRIELINLQTQERTALEHLPIFIGRDRYVDVRLADPDIRAYQCMLDESRGGGLVLWDFGTGTSVSVNGRPAARAYLASGDELTLGRTTLRIEY